MRRSLPTLAVLLAAATAAPAAHADGLTGRLLVTLEPAASTATAHASANATLARAGARPASPLLSPLRLMTARPERGSLKALARRLRADPAVANVEVERRYTIRSQPADPALSEQEPAPGTAAGTPVEWWAAREGFPAAWDFTSGAGATIAVIDTGIDAQHPEFAGRIRKLVDQDSATDDPGEDDAGHGTHVSSFACAGADGAGLAGGAYDCSLIVERSDLSDFSVAQSIVDATDRGADAINMSFGTDGSRPAAEGVVDAIDYAFRRGVVLVAAAADDPVEEQGDPSNVLQPTGSGPDITQGKGLDVTAATFDDTRAGFAGRGTQISIAAYGTYGAAAGGGPRGLFGAFPAKTTDLETGSLVPPFTQPCGCRTTYHGDSRYAYLQGTSMAAPQVTAAAALVRHLNPDLTASEVIQIIKRTARQPGAPGTWNSELGWGILDAGAAVAAARVTDRRAPVSRLRVSRHPRRGKLRIRLSGGDAAPAGLVASGVASFEVWRSLNGHRARRVATTSRKRVRVKGTRGRYAFYSVAVDNAGNRESPPDRPDARVRVR